MSLVFEAPRWLWLLLPGLALVWTVPVAWGQDQGRAKWTAAAIRSVLVVLLTVATARPVRVIEERAVSAVAIFDVSTSISDKDLERERQLLEGLRAAAVAPHALRTIAFARAATEMDRARNGEPPPPLRRPPGAEALATDIAGALNLAMGMVAPDGTRRILLVSDGYATTGATAAQLARLRAEGIRLDFVALGDHPTVADVAVAQVSAPAIIRPHATFPLRIDVASDRAARVTLDLSQSRSSGGATESAGRPETLTIGPGITTFSREVRVEDETNPTIFAARVRLLGAADSDVHPENDYALLAAAPSPKPRALVVSGIASDAISLVAALRAQAIAVQAESGRTLEAVLAAQPVSRIDLIALCDVPRELLGERGLAALDKYVRDGGGLLVTGGPRAFGPGGWSGSRLEALLPVRGDIPEREDEASLALALVIDRSGSMAGPKMELTKQAARNTAEALPPDDQIAVIAFDSQATIVVPLQRAANRLRIASNISRIQPTGGTNIVAGLREAVEQLATARAKKKHAILLSDGQSPTQGLTPLLDAASAAGITISTIGVGDGVDDSVLGTVARQGGGRTYHAADPANIPRIFTRETAALTASAIVEGSTRASPRGRADLLAGIPWSAAPPLRGYVRTRARAQADIILLAAESGEPLLARWQVGLGKVVTWTSDLGPRWAGDWSRWSPWSQMWGQIARATMRPHAAHELALATQLDDEGEVEVALDAQATDDTYLAGMEGELQVTGVDFDGALDRAPPRRFPLVESAPGRYQARFPAQPTDRSGAPVAALLLRATLSQGGRPVASGGGHVSLPPAPELRPLAAVTGGADAGTARLAAWARATEGGALSSPAAIFEGAKTRQRRQPLQAAMLGATAILWVVDVAVRRLGTALRARRAG